ncbi:pterin-4-alpha-carbinolamine dehydratase [Marinobacter daqiaonensis]|uniref:Putative pterin-4-alpha-carbinolamine dehydratase n=1 Tax=Marinobacter daqiaonensis TaxID=650891 RepID=A0A1I6GGS2_9GAMM|nr:4a-hydroxytetrahydrobiopterin dehydratase [Marinobacter daqiaonensis]SFR41433.1 pterin-4-alpha-carbinolamine dehydratase [Marinobacter daqiaonensis]
MTPLAQQSCEACRSGAPAVAAEEQDIFMMQLPDWDIVDEAGIKQLQRVFRFRNFVEALVFTNRVADLAEEEGHHPAILLEFGKATVRWWTHKIHGLHRNDFIMAARTDALYNS